MKPILALALILTLNFPCESNATTLKPTTTASKHSDGVYYFKEKDEFAEIPEVVWDELNIFCYNGE